MIRVEKVIKLTLYSEEPNIVELKRPITNYDLFTVSKLYIRLISF